MAIYIDPNYNSLPAQVLENTQKIKDLEDLSTQVQALTDLVNSLQQEVLDLRSEVDILTSQLDSKWTIGDPLQNLTIGSIQLMEDNGELFIDSTIIIDGSVKSLGGGTSVEGFDDIIIGENQFLWIKGGAIASTDTIHGYTDKNTLTYFDDESLTWFSISTEELFSNNSTQLYGNILMQTNQTITIDGPVVTSQDLYIKNLTLISNFPPSPTNNRLKLSVESNRVKVAYQNIAYRDLDIDFNTYFYRDSRFYSNIIGEADIYGKAFSGESLAITTNDQGMQPTIYFDDKFDGVFGDLKFTDEGFVTSTAINSPAINVNGNIHITGNSQINGNELIQGNLVVNGTINGS